MFKPFATEFSKLVVESLFNKYYDNHDIYRYGLDHVEKKQFSFKLLIHKWINRGGFYKVSPTINYVSGLLSSFATRIEFFEYLYNLLEDEYSRDLLVKVCAYRILGKSRIKLPMNNPEYWSKINEVENTLKIKDNCSVTEGSQSFFKFNLENIGYPIKLYFNAVGIYFDFIYKCYNFQHSSAKIMVEEGDHVIDGGACSGDTALYFAHCSGDKGKVYSFEFVSSNIAIFEKNLELNPNLSNKITLFRQPLWSKSRMPMYYEVDGPGTRVSEEKKGNEITYTVTIDQLVDEGKIERVDFIKMDIEGAEIDALKGAEMTIRRFKPKLAICLYHRESDFREIPELIKKWNLGYKFYFNHYTIHAEESVLFCT